MTREQVKILPLAIRLKLFVAELTHAIGRSHPTSSSRNLGATLTDCPLYLHCHKPRASCSISREYYRMQALKRVIILFGVSVIMIGVLV